MYRPKFCAECGVKIIRLHWRLWMSRRFCDGCSQRFVRDEVKRMLIVSLALFLLGAAAGHAAKRTPPPLVIQRTQTSTQTKDSSGSATGTVAGSAAGSSSANASESIATDGYICGARTKKGTPCSRRVHSPVRCWQHQGAPAMLPLDKLRVTAK